MPFMHVPQIIKKDVLYPLKGPDKKFLWMIRSHFKMVARALPKVIASAPVVRPLRLAAQTVEMAKSWARLTPTQSLELLHFRYTDSSLCIVKMFLIPMIEIFFRYSSTCC